MPTPMTPTPQRVNVSKPIGPEVVNVAAAIGTPLQALLDRGEWTAKSLIDVQEALSTVSDSDHNNAAFAAIGGGANQLTFTDVSIGDRILLYAATTWNAGIFTADGTDPFVWLRWLVGATDVTVGGDGAYPGIGWGSTALGADTRSVTVLSGHTAVANAASLVAALQGKFNSSHSVVLSHAKLVGVHLRLGKP